MIDIKMDDDNARVMYQGDPVMVAVEMVIAISAIYNALKSEHVVLANVFRDALTASLAPDAHTWKAIENQVTMKIPTKKGDAPTGQSQGTAQNPN